MPRISTDNYNTVASWNGSQDLFVVEQPDGTKVATPAMVKQFIESGDFEATGEVKDGHGNILKDMAKSADVDAEIGDLSQTGLTGDSVAEQLGDASEQIEDIVAEKALTLVVKDAVNLNTSKDFNIGTVNGIFLVVTGHGGLGDAFGMYFVKITHYGPGTMVKPIVTPSANPITVTATEITTTGKITITAGSVGCQVGIYRFNTNI